TSSTNNSVFRGFFEKQKLTGPNFIDWCRQLRILLSIEDKLNYLEQPIPPAPLAPAGQQVAPEILAAHSAWQAKQELLQTTRDFHSYRQEEGQSVSSYVLKMKGYIDNLERLGHPVTLGLGVSLILIGLRKEYDGFVQNYNMHSMGKTVNELHAMLKLHEQTLPKSNAPALNAIRAGKKKKNMASGVGSSGIFVIELNTILNRSWIYDTVCGTHICNTTHGLRASRKLKPGALSLYVGNGQREAVEAVGAFYLCLPSGLEIVLNNCHYAPSITRGVIYVSRFVRGWSIRTRHASDRMCLYVDAEEHELGDLREPANYKAALLDPESEKWLNAMNVEMQSMKDNETDMDGNVHIYKVRLVAKGYTQTPGIDYEETFSSVADIRAIRILITIAAYYDYEIWQMDVKTEMTMRFGKWMSKRPSSMDILMKSIPMLQSVKTYLGKCFAMKDLGEAAYILGIKIYRDRSKRLIGLCQSAYIEKILKRCCMENSKRGSDIHWTTVKNILKYIRNTKDMFLVYGGDLKRELRVSCYTDAGYLTDADDLKSQTGYVFVLNGGAVDWKSAKQSIFATSFTEAEYMLLSMLLRKLYGLENSFLGWEWFP
nr:hypothetical protein [Tanacetum cinerariifolium]